MRLLVDECLPNVLVQALVLGSHDVLHAAKAAPGDVDIDVLARSIEEGCVIVTADRGFGPLVIRERRMAVGIVVVVLAQSKSEILASAEDIAARIESLGEAELTGRLTILEPERTRQRDLPRVTDRR